MDKIVLQMLKEANDNYPDDLIGRYFDLKTGKEKPIRDGGDTLALFIGREIISVLDDEDMTEEDCRERIDATLTNAAQELDRVIAHFRGTI